MLGALTPPSGGVFNWKTIIAPGVKIMVGTLGRWVKEIRDALLGGGNPIPVDIGASVDLSIDAAGLEIKNDAGNPIPVVEGFSIPAHDYIDNTYTGILLTKVEYYNGGAGGALVATIDLTYDANDNLLTATKT